VTPEELEEILRGAGRAPAPKADPSYVADLEARLRTRAGGGMTTRRPGRRRVLLPTAAGLVAAAAIALALLAPSSPDPETVEVPTSVLAEPTTSMPPTPTSVVGTTTPALTTSTTVRRAASTTTTSSTVAPATTIAPSPSTSAAPTSTSAPVRPVTTTTTAADGVQDLGLTCVVSGSSTAPAITCRWARTTSDRFASYRLIRRTQDGPEQVVSTGADRGPTSLTDTGVRNGARLLYVVTTLTADGTVVGRGQTDLVTCC
jgi:hypothetical protein